MERNYAMWCQNSEPLLLHNTWFGTSIKKYAFIIYGKIRPLRIYQTNDCGDESFNVRGPDYSRFNTVNIIVADVLVLVSEARTSAALILTMQNRYVLVLQEDTYIKYKFNGQVRRLSSA